MSALEPVRRIQRGELTAAQQLERIKKKLSPNDDDLPLAQAQRQKDEMDRAAQAEAMTVRCQLCGTPRDPWVEDDNPWRCIFCGALNRVVVELSLVQDSPV
jgi:rubrerythrin